MDDAARTVAKYMEDEPGEMTRQEIIDEVAFTLFDEVPEYFDACHDGKLEPRLLDMILNWSRRAWSNSTNSTPSAGARFCPPSPSNNKAKATSVVSFRTYRVQIR